MRIYVFYDITTQVDPQRYDFKSKVCVNHFLLLPTPNTTMMMKFALLASTCATTAAFAPTVSQQSKVSKQLGFVLI